MRQFNRKMPRVFDDGWTILNMRRGKERRMALPLIIIETLRTLGEEKPTRDELQKLSKIRRQRFITILRDLIETKSVYRVGNGTKFRPYLYCLGEKERRP
jgi:hypothetical protein